MPTTYAAYSNLTAAHNAALAASASTPVSAASSMPNSQRNSLSSTTSREHTKKSRWQRFLNELKPIETPLPPVGIYTPLPAKGKKSSSAGKSEDSPSRRASRAFEHFKSVAGERHSVYVKG